MEQDSGRNASSSPPQGAASLQHEFKHVRKVLDAADVGTWNYDISKDAVHFDAAARRIMFGRGEAASVAFDDAIQAVHPDERDRAIQRLNAALAAGSDGYYRIDTRVVHPDDTVRWVSVQGRVIADEQATEPSRLRGVILDITDRKEIEVETRTLAEANARLQEEVRRRKDLEKEVLKAADEERARVARDVHDGLQQHLTGLSLQLSIIEDALKEEGSPTLERLRGARADLSRVMAQARRLTRRLMPVTIEERGLAGALSALAAKVDDDTSCRVTFEAVNDVVVASDEVATNLYRIAQEAVTNALKHASCASIVITLSREDGRAMLVVADDGTGFKPENQRDPDGIGLRTMEYRADLIGGELRIESAPQEGTRVCCTFSLA